MQYLSFLFAVPALRQPFFSHASVLKLDKGELFQVTCNHFFRFRITMFVSTPPVLVTLPLEDVVGSTNAGELNAGAFMPLNEAMGYDYLFSDCTLACHDGYSGGLATLLSSSANNS